MMADLVTGVTAQLAEQGLLVDVRNGAEVPAQELQGKDPATGLPIPRVIFIENGMAGNLPDRYDGPGGASPAPGSAVPSRLFVQIMTRLQACEMRVWGFDTTRNAQGHNIATPVMHRAAVNKLLHNPATIPGLNGRPVGAGDVTGVLPALYACLGMSNITWKPGTGRFDNTSPDVKFGALYIFEFALAIPVIASRIAVATPRPAVAIQGS